jgi:antirestriction protein ArdC
MVGQNKVGVDKNSAAYIGGCLKQLKNDPKLLVVQATCQAQKAVDFIFGTTYEEVLKESV